MTFNEDVLVLFDSRPDNKLLPLLELYMPCSKFVNVDLELLVAMDWNGTKRCACPVISQTGASIMASSGYSFGWLCWIFVSISAESVAVVGIFSCHIVLSLN